MGKAKIMFYTCRISMYLYIHIDISVCMFKHMEKTPICNMSNLQIKQFIILNAVILILISKF